MAGDFQALLISSLGELSALAPQFCNQGICRQLKPTFSLLFFSPPWLGPHPEAPCSGNTLAPLREYFWYCSGNIPDCSESTWLHSGSTPGSALGALLTFQGGFLYLLREHSNCSENKPGSARDHSSSARVEFIVKLKVNSAMPVAYKASASTPILSP